MQGLTDGLKTEVRRNKVILKICTLEWIMYE